MKPSMPEPEFAMMARRTGLPLSAEQVTTLYEAYGWVEAMVATLHRDRPRETEPAVIFVPETRS